MEQGGKAGRDISVFECTIRVLGGLLSAYDLTAGTLTNKPCRHFWMTGDDETFFVCVRVFLCEGFLCDKSSH